MGSVRHDNHYKATINDTTLETINDTTLVNGFSDDNHYKETINDTTLVNGFSDDNHDKETSMILH